MRTMVLERMTVIAWTWWWWWWWRWSACSQSDDVEMLSVRNIEQRTLSHVFISPA